jgi:hypothetical protein
MARARLAQGERDMFQPRGPFLALRDDLGIVGKGLMNQAPVVGIHGREAVGFTRAPDLVGILADAPDEIELLLLAETLHVDDDVGGALLAAVEDAVEKILEVVEIMAVAADDARGLAGADVQDGTSRLFVLLDLEDQAKVAQHEFQSFPCA